MARYIDIDKMTEWIKADQKSCSRENCISANLDCNECYYNHGGAVEQKWIRSASRMSNTENAIDLLLEMKANCEQGQMYDDPKRKDKAKALDMAIEALEKVEQLEKENEELKERNTPKKPKLANNIYKQKCYWCPTCSHLFMESIDDKFDKSIFELMTEFHYKYCSNCGQRIDWSD